MNGAEICVWHACASVVSATIANYKCGRQDIGLLLLLREESDWKKLNKIYRKEGQWSPAIESFSGKKRKVKESVQEKVLGACGCIVMT